MKVIPNSQTRETIKTVVIAILVASIIGFVAGVKYEQGQAAKLQSAVQAAQSVKASK